MEFNATTKGDVVTLDIEGEPVVLDWEELRQGWLVGQDVLEIEVAGKKTLLKIRSKGGPFGAFEPLFEFYEPPEPLPQVRTRIVPLAEKNELKTREVIPRAAGPVRVRKTSGEEPFVSAQVNEEFEKAAPRIRIRGDQGEIWTVKPSAWSIKIQEAVP